MTERLYYTPMGISTVRPAVELPPIERRALVASAHIIAKRMRPHMASYREALAYGLRAARQQVAPVLCDDQRSSETANVYGRRDRRRPGRHAPLRLVIVGSVTMAPIPFTSPRPWRWIASDLLEALRLAQTEIHNPGAARRAGKDIDAIVSAAINSAENDSPAKTEDQPCCK